MSRYITTEQTIELNLSPIECNALYNAVRHAQATLTAQLNKIHADGENGGIIDAMTADSVIHSKHTYKQLADKIAKAMQAEEQTIKFNRLAARKTKI